MSEQNYTPELVTKLLQLYEQHGTEGLEIIAEQLQKPVRSIRSKLVREGVYVPADKASVAKSEGPSKKQLLRELEARGFNVEGFETATKPALHRLLGIISN